MTVKQTECAHRSGNFYSHMRKATSGMRDGVAISDVILLTDCATLLTPRVTSRHLHSQVEGGT